MAHDFHLPSSFLMSGRDLHLSDAIVVHHPSISDIMQLGKQVYFEEMYWLYVSTLLADPYEHMVWLDDNGLDFEEVSPFIVFAMQWLSAEGAALRGDKPELPLDIVQDALSFFLGRHTYKLGKLESGLVLYAEDDPNLVMDEGIFSIFVSFLEQINCITHSDRIKPANKNAKRILIEDTRDEERKRRRKKTLPEPPTYLSDCISAVVYGGNNGVSPFNYQDLKIYQLIFGAMVTHKHMRSTAMFNGIYTGMLNTEKLPDDALRWDSSSA